MRLLAALLLTAVFSNAANAQSIVDSPAADETRLTIYPDNLAMVTEVRKVTLPKGKTTLRLFGVSDQIIPQTVVLQEFEGFSIEQNFTSDLLSKGSLLANAIGETVTIARVNPATGEVTRDAATLVSAANRSQKNDWQTRLPVLGAVFEIDGNLEALECSGLGEAIAFRKIPETLNPTPVLSIDVKSETAGEAELVVSYLSSGISWKADYRVDVNEAHTEGDMLGWLTVTNSTAKTFKNVETAIVAGQVNRRGSTARVIPIQKPFQASCWIKGNTKEGIRVSDSAFTICWDGTRVDDQAQCPVTAVNNSMADLSAPSMYMGSDEIVVTAGKSQATREDLGDYKLYRTPQPVTVAAHQTKQVAFLSVTDAELERLYKFNYAFEPSTEPRGATVQYEIDNSKDGKLAQPLPEGIVRVMTQRANGRPAYLGEDDVENLAVDLPVEIEISTSPSVLSSEETRGISMSGQHTLRLSGEIFNATPSDIIAEVELKNRFIRADNISDTSHALDPDEVIPTFQIPVKAESSQDYRIDLPVERVFEFVESNIKFERYEPGMTDKNWGKIEYRLAGQYGGNAWPTRFFADLSQSNVFMTSKMISREMAKNAKERVGETLRMQQVFENQSAETATIRFVIPINNSRGLEIEIIDPSFAPTGNDPLVWQFELKAGQKKTLKYSRRSLTK